MLIGYSRVAGYISVWSIVVLARQLVFCNNCFGDQRPQLCAACVIICFIPHHLLDSVGRAFGQPLWFSLDKYCVRCVSARFSVTSGCRAGCRHRVLTPVTQSHKKWSPPQLWHCTFLRPPLSWSSFHQTRATFCPFAADFSSQLGPPR